MQVATEYSGVMPYNMLLLIRNITSSRAAEIIHIICNVARYHRQDDIQWHVAAMNPLKGLPHCSKGVVSQDV